MIDVVEHFHVEAFVPEFSVEAFAVRVLPWFARIDVYRFSASFIDPFFQCVGDKLRAVVAADERGRAVFFEEPLQNLDHLF